jgi:hypothetical protein
MINIYRNSNPLITEKPKKAKKEKDPKENRDLKNLI